MAFTRITSVDPGVVMPVSGTFTIDEVAVTSLPALPAGTNEIGKVQITAPTWTDFHKAYGAGDGTGDKEIIAAPAAGLGLQFKSITIIAGETADNTIICKKGSTAFATLPLASRMDGWIESESHPDYRTLPAATAFNVNNAAAKIFYVFGRYRTVTV